MAVGGSTALSSGTASWMAWTKTFLMNWRRASNAHRKRIEIDAAGSGIVLSFCVLHDIGNDK
jgi:hypothetical protein